MEQLDESTIKRGNTNTAKKFMIFLNLLIANFGCFTVWSLQKIMDFI